MTVPIDWSSVEVTPPKLPSQPWVVVVAGLKGGIGKTTMVMFLAMIYAAAGYRVLVSDSDPKSQTASDWEDEVEAAGGSLPFDITIEPHTRVGKVIRRRRADYDLILVDVGGEGADILEAAIPEADDVLVVTTPNKADVKRLMPTLQAAVAAADGVDREIGVRIVLTKVDGRRWRGTGGGAEGSHNQQITTMIEAQGLPLMGSYIPLNTQLSDAFGDIPSASLMLFYQPVRMELESTT